jgi:hypothetical protein
MSDHSDEHDRTAYRVPGARLTRPAIPGPPQARGPVAIFVAHGMGQQIPFQTLEAVAEGLLRYDAHGPGLRAPQVATTVVVGGERLQRLELNVTLPGGSTREVHVYEGYWAPFTEGQVKLRDVAGFLLRSAIAGIQLGTHDFRRWIFGRYVRFPAPMRAVLYLLVALSLVVALAFLNGVIMTMAVARVPLKSPPSWLSDALFQDVTTILNALLCAVAPLLIVLCWATWRLRRGHERPRGTGVASVIAFGLALWSTLAAAVLVGAAFIYHVTVSADPASSLFGTGHAELVGNFNTGFDIAATVVLLAVVLFGVGRFVRTMMRELDVALHQKTATRGLTTWVLAGFLVLVGTLAGLAAAVWLLRLRGTAAAWRHGLAWPLVVAVSLAVRWFLIQYAGDVAAYVQPQTLDRFFALRQAVKDAVGGVARAIYRDPQYHEIIMVGHSLGSVVIYDVLNRLILDRQLAIVDAPEVVKRTRLLLTFGSPLDKTAFIFGTQGSGREPREALAASVQPLITDPAVRPKWINIWSPWDIVSGHLDYYDLPPDRTTVKNPNAVENMKDDRAVTLLAAHVEYWSNPLLFQQILAHLT